MPAAAGVSGPSRVIMTPTRDDGERQWSAERAVPCAATWFCQWTPLCKSDWISFTENHPMIMKKHEIGFGFSRPHESWKRLSNLVDHTPIWPEMTWERKIAATCCDANLKWRWTHTQNRLQVFSAARVFRKTLQPEKTWNQFVVSEHERDGRHVLWRQLFVQSLHTHTHQDLQSWLRHQKCRKLFAFCQH